MLVLWHDLRTYIRLDFRPGLYAATALWLAFLLTVNYWFDAEDAWIDVHQGQAIWPVVVRSGYGRVWRWSAIPFIPVFTDTSN